MKRLAIMMFTLAGLVGVTTACQGNVFSLEVGQCFNDPDAFTEVSDVEVVDCGEPHDNEVYHLFDLPDGDFPGATTVQQLANEGCLGAFEGYVGTTYDISLWEVGLLQPTSETWDQGDQEVVCFLFDLNGEQLAGSARNSNR